MKRSTFLSILTGGVLVGVGSTFLTTSFERATTRAIKRELGFLRLDEEGIRKFAAAFNATATGNTYRLAVKGYSFLGIDSSRSGKVHHIVTTYLLSTDFFRNGMDETKLVKYTGLYSPYLRPCAHPFSHAYFA